MTDTAKWIEEAFAVIELGTRLMPYEQYKKWRGVRSVLESCPIDEQRVTELRAIIDERMRELEIKQTTLFGMKGDYYA